MLVPGLLGFQGFLLLFLPILCLVIRGKWRNATARKEEITRLLVMASQESSLAELQATVEYSSIPVAPRYHCAVCYSPTTTRCSQCKAVRYCSGKCQIVHWRQGHRDDCRPLTAATHLREGSYLHEESMSQKKSETHSDGFEGDGKAMFMSSDSLVMGDDKIELSDVTSFNTSPSFGRIKMLVGAFPNEEVRLSTSDREAEHHYSSTFPSMLGMRGSTNAMGENLLPSGESNVSVNCVNNSGSSKYKKMTNEEVDVRLKFSNGKIVGSEDIRSKKLGNRKPIREVVLSEEVGTTSSKYKHSVSSNSLRSDPVAKDREDHSQLLKSGARSSLSGNPDDPSGDTGEHMASSYKPAKFDSAHMLTVRTGSIPRLPQTSRNGLKASMHKVVTQFRASKNLKLNIENGITGRYNHKMLFPYELFEKLYSSDDVELCPFGLTNCGNSCYANAVLQCLAFTRPLTSYLLQGFHSAACRKRGWCFICEFQSLILKATEGKSPLSLIGILSKIQKIGSHLGQGREEDAHEFLRYAVDTMQSIFLKESGATGPLAEETTLVGLTFGGYLQSKIKCLKCLGKSERYERMMDLTVEIDGEIETLEEALSQFTATEILDGENKYHCSRCTSFVKAKKKLTIFEAPNILTVVLKRFQSSNFEKLNKSIRYPEVLNMAPYMIGASDRSPLYSLYAVVVHLDIMNAAYSGHYICYVKNLQGKWFKTDDSTVIPVDLDRVLQEGAYMLLYARHSPRPPTLMVNNQMSHCGKVKKRNLEVVPSSHSALTSKTRSNSLASDKDASTSHKKLLNHQFINLDDWRSHSSSESSLFSSSDASSCSTASTKDSSSTEDISDYIFGEVGQPNWYKHYACASKLAASTSYLNYADRVENGCRR